MQTDPRDTQGKREKSPFCAGCMKLQAANASGGGASIGVASIGGASRRGASKRGGIRRGCIRARVQQGGGAPRRESQPHLLESSRLLGTSALQPYTEPSQPRLKTRRPACPSGVPIVRCGHHQVCPSGVPIKAEPGGRHGASRAAAGARCGGRGDCSTYRLAAPKGSPVKFC